MEGEFLDYSADHCTIVGGGHICDGTSVKVRRQAATCGESLLVERIRGAREEQLPGRCLDSLRVVVSEEQEYLKSEGYIVLFSHKEDVVWKKAENGTRVDIGKIRIGVNKIRGTGRMYTSDLVLHAGILAKERVELDELVEVRLADDLLNLTDVLSAAARINDTVWRDDIREFVKSEGKVGADITRTRGQLKHIEAVHITSNFSASQFTLNKVDGIDGAISWLALIVVIIIIALLVMACCGSCACCRACGSGMCSSLWCCAKGACGLLGNMVCYLYRSQPEDGDGHRGRVRGPVGAEGTEMVESPQKQEQGNGMEAVTVPNWQVVTLSEERLVVHCVHEGKEYVYNMSTRKVYDLSGKVCNVQGPDNELVSDLARRISLLKVPGMVTDGGRRTLVNFPEVYFDAEIGEYCSVKTGMVVSGFRKPIY
jgi:hypothetical protein